MRKQKTLRISTSQPKSTAEELTPEGVADCVHYGFEILTDTSLRLQAIAERFPIDDARHVGFQRARDEMDDRIAYAARNTMMLRHLAKTTNSAELLISVAGDALHSADDLPELLQRCDQFAEPSDLDGSTSDSFYFHFAETVVSLVKHLEELSTKYPERFRLLARELPYWPMLVFRHKAANNHLFDKSADGQKPLADLLDLGSDCPINVSNRANYSLKTPINAFLWNILSQLHWGRGWVRSIRCGRIVRATPGQTDMELMCERARISCDEAAIHFKAFDLPPLDKSTCGQWTEDVLMPWIRLKCLDLREEPVFASTPVGPNGRSFAGARKLVARALKNLAREPGAGWA